MTSRIHYDKQGQHMFTMQELHAEVSELQIRTMQTNITLSSLTFWQWTLVRWVETARENLEGAWFHSNIMASSSLQSKKHVHTESCWNEYLKVNPDDSDASACCIPLWLFLYMDLSATRKEKRFAKKFGQTSASFKRFCPMDYLTYLTHMCRYYVVTIRKIQIRLKKCPYCESITFLNSLTLDIWKNYVCHFFSVLYVNAPLWALKQKKQICRFISLEENIMKQVPCFIWIYSLLVVALQIFWM